MYATCHPVVTSIGVSRIWMYVASCRGFHSLITTENVSKIIIIAFTSQWVKVSGHAQTYAQRPYTWKQLHRFGYTAFIDAHHITCAETRLTWENYILNHCCWCPQQQWYWIYRMSLFHGEGFQLPAPSQCWEMSENANILLRFQR